MAANARLFATVAQAMDEALISVFDAKYHYNFWRPTTAIRNGDVDFRWATEVGAAMGRQVGELAVAKQRQALRRAR